MAKSTKPFKQYITTHSKYHPWDYTFLYRHIYVSLKDMKPFIIGKNSNHVISKRFIRTFKEALELARRVSKGKVHSKGFPSRYRTVDHEVRDRIRNGSKEEKMIAKLLYLIYKHSQRWWD